MAVMVVQFIVIDRRSFDYLGDTVNLGANKEVKHFMHTISRLIKAFEHCKGTSRKAQISFVSHVIADS